MSMRVQVVHFTEGATDPVQGFRSHGVRVVTLADGAGADETYVSCLHFEPGGWISDPPAVRDSALLSVHGEATLMGLDADTRAVTGPRLELSPGVGLILSADAGYRLHSDSGAIVLVVEAERLESTEKGRSTPERIMGATWPGEDQFKRRRTWLSVLRLIRFRSRFWRPILLARMESSGWAGMPGETSWWKKFVLGRRVEGRRNATEPRGATGQRRDGAR
jgi:hypothetical protein